MKVLMCPPLHYEPAPGEDGAAVMAEWRGLYRLLREELDVQVDLLEPRPDLPKLVLAASGGLVWKDSFIASHPRDLSRRPESQAWANFFLVRGYAMPELPEECCLDGERDLVVAEGKLFAGYRAGENLAAHKAVSEFLYREVHSLCLSDEWEWPLDSCLCPLGAGRVLYHPEAFCPEGRGMVETQVPGLQPVDAGDARRFACNALVANGHTILPEGCESTAARLEQEGFQVHTVPVSSYARHGAGPKALALKVED